jgi:hypothetical protein
VRARLVLVLDSGGAEADDRRSDHVAVAVIPQHMLALSRQINVLPGLRQIPQAQVDIAQVGVERRALYAIAATVVPCIGLAWLDSGGKQGGVT